ncbi:DUF4381 domain-containing protein [Vibrio hippocampi]|uniref:DUF4381 domain-containing protein n=1 Tax=Vibrio hippocampi TaxID=654686 RepID=A0ABM8ZLQ6_9VIBR|nr:DUF4381 domain-containing protein [Vibrio hippocampi]CAH0529014.1 hypothetical protein VHP8226_03007 [Vibrio hippocampi]
MSQLSSSSLLPLNDIHLPAEPTWWPFAIGYWLVLGIAICSLIVSLIAWKKRKQKRRAKRAAITLLALHPEQLTPSHAIEVVRQAALSYFPRQQIAKLTGEDWLTFLDSQLAEPVFRPKSSQWYQALYAPQQHQAQTEQQMIQDCRHWVTSALPPKRRYRNWDQS